MTRQPCVQEIMKTDGVEWTMMFKAILGTRLGLLD
jgi:hypothetical protein